MSEFRVVEANGWDEGYAAGVRATRRFLTTMSEVEGSANPYVLPVNRMGASADVAWREGFAAGRAALPDPPTGNPYPVPDAMVSDEEHYAMGLYEGYEAGWAACEAAALPDERLREALTRANDDLILIADEAPEDIGESIDSVRAAIKDALAAADREKPDEDQT